MKKGAIKELEALPIILQIANGIEYLYTKGIYHRDIKTENILISENSKCKWISRCGETFGLRVRQNDQWRGSKEQSYWWN